MDNQSRTRGPLAFCPNGHVFESGVLSGKVTNVTFVNCVVRCPACSALAEITDGTFDFLEDTIRVLVSPAIPVDRIRSLHTILAQVRGEQPKRIIDAIRETVPELADEIARRLPKDPNKLAAWVAVLIAVAAFLLQLYSVEERPPQVTPQQIEQIIRTITSNPPSSRPQQQPGQQAPPQPRTEPGSTSRHQQKPGGSVPAGHKRHTPPKRHESP